jgi:hypothetical protein
MGLKDLDVAASRQWICGRSPAAAASEDDDQPRDRQWGDVGGTGYENEWMDGWRSSYINRRTKIRPF